MKKLLLCLLLIAPAALAQPKSLFYMTDHPDSVRDFMQHQDKIDIIVPTWYNIDQDGLLYGEPDPGVLRVVKQRHMELFPIVALFNKSGAHTLFTSDKAQTAMIAAFLSEC